MTGMTGVLSTRAVNTVVQHYRLRPQRNTWGRSRELPRATANKGPEGTQHQRNINTTSTQPHYRVCGPMGFLIGVKRTIFLQIVFRVVG